MDAMKTPCNDCPFRKDSTEGWLGESRITEIISGSVLGDQYFVCHKTTGNNSYDGGDLPIDEVQEANTENRLCAGKLILEGKVNPFGNSSTRMAIMFGFLDGYENLRGQELIFDSIEDCVNHHKY